MSAEADIFNFMPLTKQQKQKIIEDLKEEITKQKTVIFADLTGLKVEDLSILRKRLKAADSKLKVARKTLLKLAFKEKGLEIDEKRLEGEIALIFGYRDEISPAKIVYEFSQENPNLKILGGFIGNKFYEPEEIINLAQLPTREELLARLVGSIFAPATNFVRVLQGNMRNLIHIFSQIKPST